MRKCEFPDGRRIMVEAAGRTAFVSVASRKPIEDSSHVDPNSHCRIKSLIVILQQNKDDKDGLPLDYNQEFTCSICTAYVQATIELIRPSSSDDESLDQNYYPDFRFPSEK